MSCVRVARRRLRSSRHPTSFLRVQDVVNVKIGFYFAVAAMFAVAIAVAIARARGG